MSVTERREKIANSTSDRYFKKGRAIITYKEKSAYIDYDPKAPVTLELESKGWIKHISTHEHTEQLDMPLRGFLH